MEVHTLAQPPLPRFDVQIATPDIAPWLRGNTGVHGVTSYAAAAPGPHVALIALTHGNEIAGAVVLDRLLRDRLRPLRGRLSFGFANLGAFERFDPEQPTASRFIDEDLNRLWDPAVLAGPRTSHELERAREMQPFIETVDVLLDLHSMLWPSDPLLLSGETAKGRALATGIGTPPLVVADSGHVSGRRLIDYGRFADPGAPQTAVLVEAGQHWEAATVETMLAAVGGFLRHLKMVTADGPLPPPLPGAGEVRYAEVTVPVTANTSSFAFVRPFRGGDVIAQRNTLIAMDGNAEIRTPHDDCLLVMPSPRPSRGHTAVRLARFVSA
ncbi:MAG TPA: succinylglutamate desuccinylase/aspartoacylase family protein [Acetobacteraceae bacterium]|jgi:predicted deacylase|nr:succinylglutamate desuccinylase/aspartoacylase family protein [Acetobacteraceae bacterium]